MTRWSDVEEVVIAKNFRFRDGDEDEERRGSTTLFYLRDAMRTNHREDALRVDLVDLVLVVAFFSPRVLRRRAAKLFAKFRRRRP